MFLACRAQHSQRLFGLGICADHTHASRMQQENEARQKEKEERLKRVQEAKELDQQNRYAQIMAILVQSGHVFCKMYAYTHIYVYAIVLFVPCICFVSFGGIRISMFNFNIRLPLDRSDRIRWHSFSDKFGFLLRVQLCQLVLLSNIVTCSFFKRLNGHSTYMLLPCIRLFHVVFAENVCRKCSCFCERPLFLPCDVVFHTS